MSTEAMKEALHRISLSSQNSASSKEDCGRIARAALAQQADEPVAPIAMVKVYGCYDAAQIPLEVRGVYQIDGFTTGVYVNMPSGACAPFAPAAPAPQRADEPVAPAIVWLWTHCKAIGMTKKSDSGLMRDDIALFTVTLKEAAAPAAPAYVPLSDDDLNSAWMRRDCIEAIQRGDIMAQFRSVGRAIEALVVARMKGIP